MTRGIGNKNSLQLPLILTYSKYYNIIYSIYGIHRKYFFNKEYPNKFLYTTDFNQIGGRIESFHNDLRSEEPFSVQNNYGLTDEEWGLINRAYLSIHTLGPLLTEPGSANSIPDFLSDVWAQMLEERQLFQLVEPNYGAIDQVAPSVDRFLQDYVSVN